MSYVDFTAALRRRDILIFLKECGGRLGDEVIRTAIEGMGYPRMSLDAIREDISFLQRRGLVREEWSGDILIALSTRRGVEVAEGRLAADGIEKPEVGV